MRRELPAFSAYLKVIATDADRCRRYRLPGSSPQPASECWTFPWSDVGQPTGARWPGTSGLSVTNSPVRATHRCYRHFLSAPTFKIFAVGKGVGFVHSFGMAGSINKRTLLRGVRLFGATSAHLGVFTVDLSVYANASLLHLPGTCFYQLSS